MNTALLVATSVKHPRQDCAGTGNYFETCMKKMCPDDAIIFLKINAMLFQCNV